MFTKTNNPLNEAMVFVTITIFANLSGNAKQCFTDAQPSKMNPEYTGVLTEVEALLHKIQELKTITVALHCIEWMNAVSPMPRHQTRI